MKKIAAYAVFTWAISLFGTAYASSMSVTVVDKDGKPAPDAVVVLMPSAKGSPKSTPPLQATIAQEKMQFVPALTVVAQGAKVRFVNNDPWDHHVRGGAGGAAQLSDGKAAGNFEIRLEGKGDGKPAKSQEITMDKVGAQSAVLLGCFIHGSMRGNVYVTESPYASKTNAQGLALFEDVPEGPVQVKVWHADQLIDLPTQQIRLEAAPTSVHFQLQVVPRRKRV
jgi:plastocyanin